MSSFEVFLEWLKNSNLPYASIICSILATVFGFVVMVVQVKKYRIQSKQFKEENNLIKYQTAEQKMAEKREGQKFSNTVTDYILDPVTNELEVSPVPKDVQAYIESYIDVALDRALERFLPKNVIADDNNVADYTQHSQDLSVMGEAFDLAEEYRAIYNLGDKMSVSEIYDYVSKEADKMKENLLKYNQKMEVNDNGKTEEVK